MPTLTLSSVRVLPSGKVTLISIGTFLLNSSSLRSFTDSYISFLTFNHPGLASRWTKLDPPMRVPDSIRGPVAALARRPWRPPPLFLSEEDAPVAVVSRGQMASFDAFEIRAALTAGSSCFQKETTSSGTVSGLADPWPFPWLLLWLLGPWFLVLRRSR